MHDWSDLTRLTQGEQIIVQRVKLANSGIAIEGDFQLPPLAQLPFEDQVFVAVFVRRHGSIKEMEEGFGVSYPTVKNRLNSIGRRLELSEMDVPVRPERAQALEDLDKGAISFAEALKRLAQC